MKTALLLGGPCDGKVFLLTEHYSHRILTMPNPEIGVIGDWEKDASIRQDIHTYEQVTQPTGWPDTRYTIFVHRGLH